eukprot:g950.t1
MPLPRIHAAWRPGPELAAVLHRLAEGDPTLHAIRLHSEIGDNGVRMIAAMLHVANPNLTEVFLSGNDVGDEGAALFADALKDNSSIVKVHFGRNRIGDDGARALAEALTQNASVRELVLYENRIGDDGVGALAEMLRANKTLEVLSLADNPAEHDGWEQLVDVLDDPSVVLTWRLREIDGADLAEHHEQLRLPPELAGGEGTAFERALPADPRARAQALARRNTEVLAFLRVEAGERARAAEEAEAQRLKEAGEDWD